MSEFGDEYGELFGDAVAEIETHVEDALNTRAYPVVDAVELAKLIAIYTERTQTLENAIRGVTVDLLFDIPTSYGVQLDAIGSLLNLPREGWDDPTYRIFLTAQSLLILPDRRTQEKLIAVTRVLVNNPAAPIVYREFRPKSYSLAVGGVDLLTLSLWIKFLERCRPATYIAQHIFIPDEPFGFEDGSPLMIPDTVFPFSDATNVVPGGGHWAAVL